MREWLYRFGDWRGSRLWRRWLERRVFAWLPLSDQTK
jgi:hypothetical protein